MSKKKRKACQSKKSGKPNRPTEKHDSSGTDSQLQQLKQRYRENPKDLNICLEFAEYCRSHGRDKEILEILSPLETDYPFDDPKLTHRFDCLYAYGHAFAGNLVDAEQVINRGMKNKSDSPDLSYLQCFVRLSLRNFDEATKAGESYLAIVNQIRESGVIPDSFSLTAEHLSQLCNFLATAYR